MHKIGEDISERLDVIPALFRVLVTRRPKYACRRCESAVVQAPAPAHKAERPAAHLIGFTGVLQVDGYAGYRLLAQNSQVMLASAGAMVEHRVGPI
jgi:hypothetical protein